MLLPRAYYSAPVAIFLASTCDTVLGRLAANSEMAVEPPQRDAWLQEIAILKEALHDLPGTLFLEFSIPRMGKRIDAVVVSGAVVFVIEFKVGENRYTRADLDQVWDYALDLKNFHQASHNVPILPILVATEAPMSDRLLPPPHDDQVYPPVQANRSGLRRLIDIGLGEYQDVPLDGVRWGTAPYHPTPTIIQAAQSLYAQHSVDAIARHDAGARNLRATSARIEELVEQARSSGSKMICLVTGVPGAGKTLVGLNIATKRRDTNGPTHAVFLSGNGPLVAVLREALTRDEVARRRSSGERVRKGKVGESVKAFIQNVHHFRDEALRETAPPIDHVVIFDEAQRAWNRAQTSAFMRTKKKMPGFSKSEPEFLISYLDRHNDWAVIVCLVGGGQEINKGEAGIGAWLDAINAAFPKWHVYISPELTDSEYAAGHAIDAVRSRPDTHFDSNLHLAVSMRSFRAENVAGFVKAVLDCEIDAARDAYSMLSRRYPIALTRNLDRAREWIRQHARGTERYGLVASSEAQRLKPHAIDVRVNIDPVHWFLDDGCDTRSSLYLEDAASQFDIQGLELDWICVNWDADLRFAGSSWSYHIFRGDRWCGLHKEDRRNYLRNAYRVLLTRARQGMVIFVPPGEASDPTRSPAFYDSTFQYLTGLGIPVLMK
ncbi:MAG TPA: DUF2075 domain-containing protein [Candidatus Paceibacterota bacterium]|nr:DUF2075 domain-containing protein [Verrucomicrobiota bacterium]HOX04423.1 DUF2075 domain-containing protein [Verrucomicrobiota bacterium]HRZ47343.1 DUF2075 domain-containing protein [Candidatus Paceibacterota bacterium]HRZ94250.1 DUF2075 domain-containing protein [Candidatus Paceibacterota bacterium]